MPSPLKVRPESVLNARMVTHIKAAKAPRLVLISALCGGKGHRANECRNDPMLCFSKDRNSDHCHVASIGVQQIKRHYKM